MNATATSTIERFSSREEILNSGLPAYENSLLLAAWDAAHPPAQTARDRIVQSGNSAHRNAIDIAALPPEQPARPKLLPGERAALAEAKNKLKAIGKEYAGLIAKREQGQQVFEQTAKEKRRLETTLDFDDAQGIQNLIFVTARASVTQNWLNAAADKIRGAENAANLILSGVDKLFNRKFGPTKEPGGRLWANAGMGPTLPARIDDCCAAITNALDQK